MMKHEMSLYNTSVFDPVCLSGMMTKDFICFRSMVVCGQPFIFEVYSGELQWAPTSDSYLLSPDRCIHILHTSMFSDEFIYTVTCQHRDERISMRLEIIIL